MSADFEALLRGHGRPVTLYPKDGGAPQEGFAFLQPLREGRGAQSLPSPLGEVCNARFLYLGSAALALDAAEHLCCEGCDYEITRAQLIYLGRAPNHWRGVLRLREEEAFL